MRSGCLELIASMRERGVPVAAAGTGEPESIDRFFRSAGLVGFFDVVVCRDEVWRLPPAPDLLELAAYRVGVAPPRCVALWSSTSGLEAARAAGHGLVASGARVGARRSDQPRSHPGSERFFTSLDAARDWLVQRVTGESAFAPLAV